MAGICASAAPISTNVEDIRKSQTFHPSIWTDHFLSYTSDVTEISAAENEQLEKQKEKVKKLLSQTPNESTIKMKHIDAIQRLGVGYHFVKEIEQSLRQIHHAYQVGMDDDDVGVVALRFRLLRQQGYRAPCDVFKKFMDDQGNFKESLINDVEGLLSLYEASYYGVDGEEILDKAMEFSSSHLESLVHQMSSSSTSCTSVLRRLKEALETPISKTLVRIGATKFISTYEEDESHNRDLLNFAKLDFSILQKIHQKEANHIARWWKDLDFTNKTPFARDREIECYFWSLGTYFEPHYQIARIFLAKVLAMATIIDDIYDVYGSLDDLRRFTHTFESWDISSTDELPPYMRICFDVLSSVYAEMEDELAKQGKSYRLQYAKLTRAEVAKAYMVEAEWCYSKFVPTMDEYMKVALLSSAYLMVATSALVGMDGETITQEHFDWIVRRPRALKASETICRLMDDIVGYKREEKVTAVSCYMNVNGCSDMEACSELSKQVDKAWKDLNDEWMEPREASAEIIARIINLTRIIQILYSKSEGFTDSSTTTKEAIKALLVDLPYQFN